MQIIHRSIARLCRTLVTSSSSSSSHLKKQWPDQGYLVMPMSFYSSKTSKGSDGESPMVPAKKRKSWSFVVDEEPEEMDESEAFYIVQKGSITGVYRNFEDCRSMILDPACMVFKGYNMQKRIEEFLRSRGLVNPLFSVNSEDIMSGVFGSVVPCKFPIACLMEFDGSSMGNPGIGGAGVVLRSTDGTIIRRLREGLGHVTSNEAEYRALNLGLRNALKKGIKHIHVQGDSQSICKQLRGQSKPKTEHILAQYNEAKELRDQFSSFQIKHIPRALNSEADGLAKSAVELKVGQVEEL